MNKKIKTDAVDHLFQAILTLKTPEECYTFFEDVCTVNELLSLSQRYEVAKMLREGRTYLEIAEKTGASTATISRVNRSLNYGNDGNKETLPFVGTDSVRYCFPKGSVLSAGKKGLLFLSGRIRFSEFIDHLFHHLLF